MSLIQSAQQKLKKIDNSKVFQGIVIAVIILSALLIGAKTHNLSANAVAVLLLLDVAVTIFFAVEISIRYLAYPNKKQFF
jgi:voltage-gated sodium channel